MDNLQNQAGASNSHQVNHIRETQKQVDDVLNLMRDNVDKVLERDEKLTELDERAESLKVSSNHFAQNTVRLRRKYWWENMKLKIILGAMTVIVLIIILLSVLI